MFVEKRVRSKIKLGTLQFIAAKIATQEEEGISVYAHPTHDPKTMLQMLSQESADTLTGGRSNATVHPDYRVSFLPAIFLAITYLGKGIMEIDLEKKVIQLIDFRGPEGKTILQGLIAVVLGEQFRDFKVVTKKI